MVKSLSKTCEMLKFQISSEISYIDSVTRVAFRVRCYKIDLNLIILSVFECFPKCL